MSRDTDQNRTGWNARSDGYQKDHGELLERTAQAWGVWRVPERWQPKAATSAAL